MADIDRYRRFGINSKDYDNDVECISAAIIDHPIAVAEVIIDLLNRIETLEKLNENYYEQSKCE